MGGFSWYTVLVQSLSEELHEELFSVHKIRRFLIFSGGFFLKQSELFCNSRLMKHWTFHFPNKFGTVKTSRTFLQPTHLKDTKDDPPFSLTYLPSFPPPSQLPISIPWAWALGIFTVYNQRIFDIFYCVKNKWATVLFIICLCLFNPFDYNSFEVVFFKQHSTRYFQIRKFKNNFWE